MNMAVILIIIIARLCHVVIDEEVLWEQVTGTKWFGLYFCFIR